MQCRPTSLSSPASLSQPIYLYISLALLLHTPWPSYGFSSAGNADSELPARGADYQEQRVMTVLLWARYPQMPFSVNPILIPGLGKCVVTRDRKAIAQSDVVLFEWMPLAHERRLQVRPPIRRPKGALWVYFSMESPRDYQATADRNFGKPNKNINVLMSYNPSSDIVLSYGRLYPKKNIAATVLPALEAGNITSSIEASTSGVVSKSLPLSSSSSWATTTHSAVELREVMARRSLEWKYGMEEEPMWDFTKKSKLMVVVQYHCHSALRNSRIQRLQASLQWRKLNLDMMGKCGNVPLPKNCGGRYDSGRDKCMKLLGREYKFYLSLENEDCEDYITEKVWENALFADMVPVLWSTKTNVSKHLPPGSYINIADFPSVGAAVEHINSLHHHFKRYLEYFRWRETFGLQLWLSPYRIELCRYALTNNRREKPPIPVTHIRAKQSHCIV